MTQGQEPQTLAVTHKARSHMHSGTDSTHTVAHSHSDSHGGSQTHTHPATQSHIQPQSVVPPVTDSHSMREKAPHTHGGNHTTIYNCTTTDMDTDSRSPRPGATPSHMQHPPPPPPTGTPGSRRVTQGPTQLAGSHTRGLVTCDPQN